LTICICNIVNCSIKINYITSKKLSKLRTKLRGIGEREGGIGEREGPGHRGEGGRHRGEGGISPTAVLGGDGERRRWQDWGWAQGSEEGDK
jgi:hypothetical protein